MILVRNAIEVVEAGAFEGLDRLQWLLIHSNKIEELNMETLKDVPSLGVLDLTDNKIRALGVFPHSLKRLFWLGLGHNQLSRIDAKTFNHLNALEVLILKHNKIENVHQSAFESLSGLMELDISHNQLKYLPPNVFSKLKKLNKLNLEFNLISSLSRDLFRDLYALKSLDLQGLEIKNIDIKLFQDLASLEFIYFKKFLYCSMAPYVRICIPKSDGISSTENLLLFPALRFSVWLVAIMTTFGNMIVIIWRFISRKEDKVLSQFIKNLALADFLMGCYLLLVAVKDIAYRDRYNNFAHEWLSSWLCTCCGVTAMLSSEVSVFILCLITMERFHCIRTNLRIVTLKFAGYCLAGAWLMGFVLAVIPVMTYPKDFYSVNGLCFPLHIDDPFLHGWEYSAFVFFGINFSAIICMLLSLYLFCQLTLHLTLCCTPLLLQQNLGDELKSPLKEH